MFTLFLFLTHWKNYPKKDFFTTIPVCFGFLPWYQAVSSLKSGGIQLKKGGNVVSMWDRDQSEHDLLPSLPSLP
jgi:hypothetical protein